MTTNYGQIPFYLNVIFFNGSQFFTYRKSFENLPKNPFPSIQIPETPIWLLSKRRESDAMQSLQWLRGWVQPAAVEKEFQQLCEFNKSIQTCDDCQRKDKQCDHLESSYMSKVKSMAEKYIQKPLILCGLTEVFLQLSVLLANRPYIIQIYKAVGMPVDASSMAVYMTILSNSACLCLIFLIKFAGKRPLFLASMVASALLSFGLGKDNFAYVIFRIFYFSVRSRG